MIIKLNQSFDCSLLRKKEMHIHFNKNVAITYANLYKNIVDDNFILTYFIKAHHIPFSVSYSAI
jgi:hypothetical protein